MNSNSSNKNSDDDLMLLQRVKKNIHQIPTQNSQNLFSSQNDLFIPIQGPNFESIIFNNQQIFKTLNFSVFDSYLSNIFQFGAQATELGKAIKILREVIELRNSSSSNKISKGSCHFSVNNKCTLFLGYTSNMVSTGMREIIKFLVKFQLIDCIVTSGGAIEEDLIKTFQSFFTASFKYSGDDLRSKNIAAIGNIFASNKGYCDLEDIMLPFLDEILIMQCEKQSFLSISEFIWKLGQIIDDESSILFWAQKNQIPIFCPGLIDGAIGDIIFTHSLRSKNHLFDRCSKIKSLVDSKKDYVILDSSFDLIQLTKMALISQKKATLILGGALPKHHIYNANLLANGADYVININTASGFDSSDSGGSIEEAKSWGKIDSSAKAVKICADATLVLPILIYETFCKDPDLIQKVISINS